MKKPFLSPILFEYVLQYPEWRFNNECTTNPPVDENWYSESIRCSPSEPSGDPVLTGLPEASILMAKHDFA